MSKNKNIRAQLTHKTQRPLVLWSSTKKYGLSICLRVQQEQEYTGFTEVTFVIAMEDNNYWLANNKTWKKWTRLGNGGSLSYAGINFHKPKDEE